MGFIGEEQGHYDVLPAGPERGEVREVVPKPDLEDLPTPTVPDQAEPVVAR
jgi:hypothetical protein